MHFILYLQCLLQTNKCLVKLHKLMNYFEKLCIFTDCKWHPSVHYIFGEFYRYKNNLDFFPLTLLFFGSTLGNSLKLRYFHGDISLLYFS